MTDWKKQARNHEESANEYARMNYKLVAINADLLEALRQISIKGSTGRDLYAVLDEMRNIAREAIRKAEEQSNAS